MFRKPLCAAALMGLAAQASAATPAAVLDHYADLAHAKFSDSLMTAKAMQGKIDALLAKPTEANLAAARAAWVEARHPYQQTEAYRFGNAIVAATT